MEIAVPGGCMESGVFMGTAMRSPLGAPLEHTERRFHATSTAHTKKACMRKPMQAFDWVAVLRPSAQNGNPT
jgi:hypothetical protein